MRNVFKDILAKLRGSRTLNTIFGELYKDHDRREVLKSFFADIYRMRYNLP
jgi:hypothetical protein